jgi:muramoyltetrapeptide carboxypeptidase
VAEAAPRRPRPPAAPATIGIFALSGAVDGARLAQGEARLQADGHRVVVPEETLDQWRYFAGTDARRLAAFHRLLDDPSIDVMLAARGGYGLTRVLGDVEVFAGFSDFTAFNCAALALGGLATLHGPMLAVDFGDGEPDEFMRRHFAATLWQGEDAETVAVDHGLAPGTIAGTLWGGNLSMLAHLAGTPYLPEVRGGLLYVEEIAEEPYAVERLFYQLHHAGILGAQAAILLGDFDDCVPRNPARYPYAMAEVAESVRALVGCPVLAGLPFGHVARKLTLPFGMPGRLDIAPGSWTLSWRGLALP